MAAAGGQDSQVPRSSHVLTTFSVPLTIRSHCGQTSPAVPRLLSDNVPPLTNLLSITALQVRAQAQQHPSCLTAPTPHSPAVAQKPGGGAGGPPRKCPVWFSGRGGPACTCAASRRAVGPFAQLFGEGTPQPDTRDARGSSRLFKDSRLPWLPC